jgi:hypothetical protein
MELSANLYDPTIPPVFSRKWTHSCTVGGQDGHSVQDIVQLNDSGILTKMNRFHQ